MSKCEKCGEPKVCPKCQPVIEKTNSIIVRHKDTSYNGGYPNCLVISPLWVNGNGRNFTLATLAGDNFYTANTQNMGFSFIESGTVESVAVMLSNMSASAVAKLFGLGRTRTVPVGDLLNELKTFLGREKEQCD